eukprot:450016-Pelagomonas_calceolata.AAC.3
MAVCLPDIEDKQRVKPPKKRKKQPQKFQEPPPHLVLSHSGCGMHNVHKQVLTIVQQNISSESGAGILMRHAHNRSTSSRTT